MTNQDHKSQFDYDAIPEGFYQQVLETGNPVRRAWHMQKFERVIDCLPRGQGLSILDVGCFAGTFLSLLREQDFNRQLGVDILETQIQYATRRFATGYRSFRHIGSISDLDKIDQTFDCVTLIEVIEHLTEVEIRELLAQIGRRLNRGGTFIMSTPNYISLWPLLEVVVNRMSEVSYEEQHITRFNYFNCCRKLHHIFPAIADDFDLLMRTTTHFVSPFLAAISLEGSMRVSRMVPHKVWKNPFGSLILLAFRKK
jgi:2-polyprenyl-3-methyl-5-hydroxy-6-metoxy-1,4-benzoquinol methylase